MKFLKVFDVVVFAVLFYLAAKYYAENPGIFDIVSIAAMLFVMVRNPDINTVSLISIILTVRLANTAIFSLIADDNLNPYFFYLSVTAANVIMIGVVLARPVLVRRYGPAACKNNKRLTMTHQDAMIAWLYFIHAVIPFVTLMEHIVRHLDALDLKPMFFYTLYQPAQLFLAVLGILVLYFMTFEKSKEARDERQRRKLDA